MDKSKKISDEELDSVDGGQLYISFENGERYKAKIVRSEGLEFVIEYEVSWHGHARDKMNTGTKTYTTKDLGQWYNPVAWAKRGALEISHLTGLNHTYKAGQEE